MTLHDAHIKNIIGSFSLCSHSLDLLTERNCFSATFALMFKMTILWKSALRVILKWKKKKTRILSIWLIHILTSIFKTVVMFNMRIHCCNCRYIYRYLYVSFSNRNEGNINNPFFNLWTKFVFISTIACWIISQRRHLAKNTSNEWKCQRGARKKHRFQNIVYLKIRSGVSTHAGLMSCALIWHVTCFSRTLTVL